MSSPELPGDDQLLLAMGHAMAGFVQAVSAIRADQWDNQSPCTEWSVFDVVDHVVMGDRFVVKLLSGAPLDEAAANLTGLDPDLLNPAGDVADAARAALEAFGGPLDNMVDHRVGMISARRFLAFRVVDQLGHTWDVAKGTKQPIALDPAVVEVGLGVVLAELPIFQKSDNFVTLDGGPADSQDATDTFLHLIGRRS